MRIKSLSLGVIALAGAASIATAGVASACMHHESEDSAALDQPAADAIEARYVGLTVGDAEEIAAAEGRLFRVVRIDGEEQMTTRDYRPGRINAEIVGGVVTTITVEGDEPAS